MYKQASVYMIFAESQDLFFQTTILADIHRKTIMADFQEKQESGKNID
jgi:hypothetical protein